jgi:hypothetical protein
MFDVIAYKELFIMRRYKAIPNYVARKSIWPAILSWRFLAMLISIVAAVVLNMLSKSSEGSLYSYLVYASYGLIGFFALAVLIKIIKLRCHTIEFYNGCVIEKWGIIIRNSKKTVFPRITAMSTRRNILGYGNIYIDVVGPAWDISFRQMARPNRLRNFLSYYMLSDSAVDTISNNPYIAATDGLFR